MSTVQFSIRIDPKIKERLDHEARREDASASDLAQKAIDEYLDRKEHLRRIIRNAEQETEAGVFISGEAMHAWVASWDTENELPEPAPDIHRGAEQP